MKVVLPDGAELEVPDGSTGRDVAAARGEDGYPSLAEGVDVAEDGSLGNIELPRQLTRGQSPSALKDLQLNDEQMIADGSKLYRRHCQHCHGVTGNGRGPSTFWDQNGMASTPRMDRRLDRDAVAAGVDGIRAQGASGNPASRIRPSGSWMVAAYDAIDTPSDRPQ